MIDRAAYVALSWTMIALAAVTALALRFVVAPYGRHARAGWGPTLPERWGWMIMESPSLALVTTLFFAGPNRATPALVALWGMWAAHYAQRSLVYPFRIRGRKRMPIVVVAMAIAFNVLNGTINGTWLGSLAPRDFSARDPWFVVGAVLFAAGMAINLDSDRRLFALRRPGRSEYVVPRGGLFELVASPNYFGEIVEWCGFALASRSLAGLAFALYTIANLAPRAASHLAWYRAKFPDFPRERRALVPWIW